MGVTVIKQEKWRPVTKLVIKVTKTEKDVLYLRLFCVIKIFGKEHEMDMFPYNQDFFIGGNGNFTIGATESFKMKTKVTII
jgi:hypothetical protein